MFQEDELNFSSYQTVSIILKQPIYRGVPGPAHLALSLSQMLNLRPAATYQMDFWRIPHLMQLQLFMNWNENVCPGLQMD